MFADLNREFVAEQRDPARSPHHALAVRTADQLLGDLGMKYRALPCHFRVDRATHAELARVTRLLADAQDKLLAHLCATRTAAELTALFDVPPAMARHIDWPTLPDSGLRILRADIVPGDSGYWFCELNHFCGVGAGEAYHSAHTYAEVLGRPVSALSPFRQLALLYARECRRAGLTRIVVLDTTEHQRQGFGQQLLKQRHFHLLVPGVEVAYHTERTYPEHWLRPEEGRRTLIHRVFTFHDTDDDGAFLSAVRASGATVTSMYEAELRMHRLWFALMCDDGTYGQLLTEEERAAIRQYVPHTALVTPDDLGAILADKDRLVFKRSYSYGGRGVLLGDHHDPRQLRDLLTRDGTGWIAQRRIPSPPLDLPSVSGTPVPHHLVLGMFLYGDRTAGVLVRGAPDSPVVNLSRGGGMSWAFVG
ncbi:hypothetical protein ACIRU8_00220 [Streptomyces sp. NPDC101175]|uniref:hypothetical protein n=1 Tax=Streptomyces sp. NPDC101175 TaxID=3366123 RepID=UPI003835757A